MAGFDFPSTPSVGDLFQDASSGAVYRWNGYAWIGGVTGIGLQTVKETRYLTAGSFTHTRDPKSSGLADIHLLGAFGVRPGITWASGQIVAMGGGGGGSIGIKWKYPLPATAPVVVGTPAAAGGPSGPSSFDTVLSAPGGNAGTATTAPTANSQTAVGGAGGGPATGCDESYPGQSGMAAIVAQGYGMSGFGCLMFLRGIMRKAAPPGVSGGATQPAVPGDPGAVCVVEYLNP